jgi:hypothetical protein
MKKLLSELLVVLVVLLVLLGTMLLLIFPQESRVTKAAFDRIEEGMTLAEVEAVLGGPEGDYRTRPTGLVLDPYGGGLMMYQGTLREWWGDEAYILVGFDAGGRVELRRFVEVVQIRDPGLIELLQWRLQWWRKKVFGPAP